MAQSWSSSARVSTGVGGGGIEAGDRRQERRARHVGAVAGRALERGDERGHLIVGLEPRETVGRGHPHDGVFGREARATSVGVAEAALVAASAVRTAGITRWSSSASMATRRASPRRSGSSASALASAARTDQCGSLSRPAITLMNTSGSMRASATSDAAAQRGPRRRRRVEQHVHGLGGSQLAERDDGLHLQRRRRSLGAVTIFTSGARRGGVANRRQGADRLDAHGVRLGRISTAIAARAGAAAACFRVSEPARGERARDVSSP